VDDDDDDDDGGDDEDDSASLGGDGDNDGAEGAIVPPSMIRVKKLLLRLIDAMEVGQCVFVRRFDILIS